jgi:oligopeptide transport system substrate-binding protein
MPNANRRSTAAMVLLFALLIPVLAACGGAPAGQGGDPAATSAPAAEAPTTASGSEAPTAASGSEAPTAASGGEAPTAAAQPAADTGTAQPGVLRLRMPGGSGAEPDNVDPQKASFSAEISFIMMAFQPLMSFDQEMQPIPGAAESVDVSEDGLTYTFNLRPDAKYSDGQPVTAENFEYAWKRLANPETAGEYQSLPCGLIKGYSEYSAAACQGLTMTETMALDLDTLSEEFGVRAVDETTLEIELTSPAPYFLSMAALWIGAPARQDLVELGEDWWYEAENYIGNGPFVLTEWDHGNRAVWEPNPNYVGPLGPVKLQRVEYYMITETQVAFQAYQNGELDMLSVASEDLQAVQADPVLSGEAINVAGSCTFYFGFNTTKEPFNDPLVRQGFAQAFDREAWVRDIFGGLGTVAHSFIPPGFPGYREDLMTYQFDPEAAQAAIAESSYGGVENLPEIKLTYSASARNNARFEWVASQLKTNLGIDAVLDPVDPTAYSALTKEDPPQMYYLGWCADYPDPQNWISLFQTNGLLSTRVGYSNPEFDELIIQADVEQDPARRAELYDQAHEILVNDARVAFLQNDGGPVLVKPYIQGVSDETITPLDYWLGFFNLPNVDVQP